MNELIVVACHGPDWIDQCRISLEIHAPYAHVLYVDTGGSVAHGADVAIQGGHPTGALLWAYEQYAAFDRFLLIQDSMTALEDPLPWFRDQFAGGGVVAWGKFAMQWDTPGQIEWVESQYPGIHPTYGIMGPIFYTDRETLDVLSKKGLLPKLPSNKLEAKGTERAWAYALAAAGLPLIGPDWNHGQMQTGFGPFRKVWADRS